MIDIKAIKNSGMLQHDSSDCGTACLVTLIKYNGGESTIENIRKLSGTDQRGTTMLGLLQAAEKCGFDAKGYEADINDIIEYGRELILHVTLKNGFEHFIVCFGFYENHFIIWDPANGLKYLTDDELRSIWLSKKCLGLIANKEFIKKRSLRNYSIQWLKGKIKPDLNILAASFVIGIAISALSMAMAVFTQKLIDDILPSESIKTLSLSIVLLFILLVARIFLSFVRQLMLLEQGKNFNIRVISEFFGLLLNLPKTFFDTRKKGDFIGRLNDTMRIQRVVTEFVSVYLIDTLIVLTSLIFLFFYSSVSAIITLIFLPFLLTVIYRWNHKIISSQRDVMSMYANTESNYIDSLGGITEIKSLGWKDQFNERNILIFSQFQERTVKLGKIKVSLGMIAGFSGTIYLISILTIASVLVFKSRISSGELLAILSICSGILPSVLNLSLLGIPISEVKVAVSRMFEFSLSKPEELSNVSNYDPFEIEHISLKDISFRFPGRSLLLKGINLNLRKGSIISLTGESGGGKSTIAGIILRFYDPESGEIIINEENRAEIVSKDIWRSKVIIIPQEIHIFNGTILQNLLADPTEEKLKKMSSMINEFGLVRFFDSFPAGVLTQVGEDGLRLSGGQKQIIAFVRAMFLDPDFLIIDEGTSNLDRHSEELLIKILQQVKDRTGVLMISHKSDLINSISDEIYFLDGGIISCMQVRNNMKVVN